MNKEQDWEKKRETEGEGKERKNLRKYKFLFNIKVVCITMHKPPLY